MEEIRARDAIRWALDSADVTAKDASVRMGRSQNFLSCTTQKGSTTRVATYARLLEVLGGELRMVRGSDGDAVAVRAG